MKEKVKEKKPVSLKKRVSATHAKAEFVGFLYLIATVFLAVMSFFPLIYGTSVGAMNVTNFWKPLIALKNIDGSGLPVLFNAGVSIIYVVLLLTVVINVFRSLSCLGLLFKKKASRVSGFNRNEMAMEKMGKIFSGTYCVFIAFPFMIHLITGAGFANLFYFSATIGLIFHFWAGLVGGNVSTFTVGENVTEEKRKFGRIAPFFRNLAQLVFVGLIMYFISETNLMLNMLKWAEKGAFSELFKGPKMDLVYYGIIPLGQLLICIWTLVLLKHATASTEFQRDGKEASGMKNFRVFSILLLITAGAFFGFMCFASTKRDFVSPQMGTLYIAIIAFAALIEEFCMCRLPNVKGAVEDDEEEGTEENPEVQTTNGAENTCGQPQVPVVYQIPLQCISQPGVFMQPNGQPVMIMPMVAGTQPAQQLYGNPYATSYGWASDQPYRQFNPYQYVQESTEVRNEEKTESPAAEEKPLSIKERKENLAADRKALRNEAALAKKESKAAAERAAVEKALADKWMKKAKQPVEASEPSKNAIVPAAESSNALVPVENPSKEALIQTHTYQNPYSVPATHHNYPEATGLTEEDLEKPLPPKKWTVSCPDCAMKLTVKEGAFAYRCPECGGVFQIRKIYRARQNDNKAQ